MGVALKERLKNLVILILIVTGIIQVGILFGYQSHGTPTNFIMGLFSKSSQISDEEAKERLFLPNRLILSDGVQFRILKKESEIHRILWEEARKNLSVIASGNLGLKASSEKWSALIEKKGIILDFGYQMPSELLKWFLGVKSTGNDLPEIRKIMIKPDIVDQDTGLVYLYDGRDKVYVSDTVSFGIAVNLEKIYETVAGSRDYRVYNTFRSANIDETLESPPDILYVNTSPKYWPNSEYNCHVPDKAQNSDEFAEVVLGNERDRYNNSKDNRDTYQYVYGNNIYRVYADGCMTYRYLAVANSSEKGGMGSALMIAYKFADRINQLSNSEVKIQLAAIKEKRPGVYSFGFDYYLKDMPVMLDKKLQVGDGIQMEHAVNIHADDKRVLQSEWLLRDFDPVEKGNYNDRFIDLMQMMGIGYDKIKINNVLAGYFINSAGEGILKPSLLIEQKDQSIVQIEMPSEKGD